MSTSSASKKTYSLPDLIGYYECCNRAEAKSAKTVSWYSDNLRTFDSYLKSRHLSDSIEKIDLRLLRDYVMYLLGKRRFENHPVIKPQTEHLSSYTVHGHVRTLRAFFSWLNREGFIKNNIARELKPPKVVRKIITTLTDEEIFSILHILKGNTSNDMRNQTIFVLLLDTGLRTEELVNLKIGDIDVKRGLLKVLGKGKKERMVPFGSNAQRALQGYIFRYRPEPANLETNNVFLSNQGVPVTTNCIKLFFKKLSEESKIYRLHAHLCRHTFATRYLINGGDVFTLQQILGHSSLDMVRNYINLASNHVALQYKKFSPMDRINVNKA